MIFIVVVVVVAARVEELCEPINYFLVSMEVGERVEDEGVLTKVNHKRQNYKIE